MTMTSEFCAQPKCTSFIMLQTVMFISLYLIKVNYQICSKFPMMVNKCTFCLEILFKIEMKNGDATITTMHNAHTYTEDQANAKLVRMDGLQSWTGETFWSESMHHKW